jgi:hypothetical protein
MKTKLSPLFTETFRAANEDAPDFVADKLAFHGYTVERGERYVYAPGTIPILLVAHTDTIHRRTPETLYYDAGKRVVWSPTGLGADDRAGVYAILALLQRGYRPHVLFPDCEETGGQGAAEAAIDLYPSVHCLIELDRMNHKDAAVYQCCNPAWERWLIRRGWDICRGTYTDIVDLMPAFGVAGANLSVGYYSQHTLGEYLRLNELSTTIDRVARMLRNPPRRPFAYQTALPSRDAALALDLDSVDWNRYSYTRSWYER